ncbi:3902_t:CDS:2, partial [Funneliformis mosseae]
SDDETAFLLLYYHLVVKYPKAVARFGRATGTAIIHPNSIGRIWDPEHNNVRECYIYPVEAMLFEKLWAAQLGVEVGLSLYEIESANGLILDC